MVKDIVIHDSMINNSSTFKDLTTNCDIKMENGVNEKNNTINGLGSNTKCHQRDKTDEEGHLRFKKS